ncbi:hypothetical protein IHE45_17G110200 [Dioscorea alata]|uniref:Uncharacterized protein n=1 Tax=Dioscorea alata TaxID=55571 RepID=A0ACB7UEK2_DIOAL|nr:hypothetical protein IHE45_17G110200 [Dioscorea alata]
MKLEAVTSLMYSSIESFLPKDFGPQAYDTAPSLSFGTQAREYEQGSTPEWLHMQGGGAFERVT